MSLGLFCRCSHADNAADLRKWIYWGKKVPRFMSFTVAKLSGKHTEKEFQCPSGNTGGCSARGIDGCEHHCALTKGLPWSKRIAWT